MFSNLKMCMLRVSRLYDAALFFYKDIENMREKSCCFIGHRTIEETPILKEKLNTVISDLLRSGYTRFIFGSKSRFAFLCLKIVSDLKEIYPHIVRVAYDTKSEHSVLQEEKEYIERLFSDPSGEKVNFLCVDQSIKDDKMFVSGIASYIERDQLMIDNSDCCVFYYDIDYTPEIKIRSRKFVNGCKTSSQSGTAIAYRYAEKKHKQIINIFEML